MEIYDGTGKRSDGLIFRKTYFFFVLEHRKHLLPQETNSRILLRKKWILIIESVRKPRRASKVVKFSRAI